MMEGRDVVGQAQTGSGKTGAYAIPIAERLDPNDRNVQALILTPTRELALQVTEDVKAIGRGRGLKTVAVYGGASINNQIADLRRRPQIVVATPGRLLDHVGRGTVRLQSVTKLVLDEADRMLDMGFLPDVSRILARVAAERQTALFSATMPAEIRTIAQRQMRDPVWIRIDAPAPTVETVEQFYVEVAEEDKLSALRKLIAQDGIETALIFRRTQHKADRLATALARAHVGVGVIHGGMRQGARLKALREFETGKAPLLVATNVAARGLDLPAISHVINYDMPEDVETYIHRVGRTARAGREGTAITLVSQHDLEMFDRLRKSLGARFKRHPLNVYARS
jgi:ATP-dependent RNA helicase DeaD